MKNSAETGRSDRALAGAAWFAGVGTALTIAAGLSFLFVCTILPLVGKAGLATVHARLNRTAFLAALLASLALSAGATWAKFARRRLDRSPMPVLSIMLAGLCLLLLVSQLAGLLGI